jgi:hypothetical protein
MKQSNRQEAVPVWYLSKQPCGRFINLSTPDFILKGIPFTTERGTLRSNTTDKVKQSPDIAKHSPNKLEKLRSKTTMAETRVYRHGNTFNTCRTNSIHLQTTNTNQTNKQFKQTKAGVSILIGVSKFGPENQFYGRHFDGKKEDYGRSSGRKESDEFSRELPRDSSLCRERGYVTPCKMDNTKKKGFHTKKLNLNNSGSRALKCALSRKTTRTAPFSDVNEDLDYQQFDIKDLEFYRSDESLNYHTGSEDIIDVVARENTDACGPIFPPLTSNKCQIKDRYSNEFNGIPSTPLLREYVRISQASVLDFNTDLENF